MKQTGSAHFRQFGNYSVALSTPVTNWKIVLLIILRSRREIKSCVSVGKSSWKKCADIAQQLRCIVKPRRFDLFKSGLLWSKPNGGTVSPWPNSKTILTLTARIMKKSCTSLHTRTSDVRWLPPRECSHASGLSRPQAKLARVVSILRSLYFQGHVAGAVVIRKRVSRPKVWEHFGELPPCLIGIDACPSAHHCGRELAAIGHTVKRIPPSYVKASTSRPDRGR